MKITCISDTHNQHTSLNIGETDFLIHAGDFSYSGEEKEVTNFLDWFKDQPAKYKILVPGNHEVTLDEDHPYYSQKIKSSLVNFCTQHNIYYLENTGIFLEGLNIYGTPWTPAYHHYGFGGERDQWLEGDKYRGTKILSSIYKQIPENTNILICHGPPKDIQDISIKGISCGSDEMLRRISSLPNLNCYINGHIHHSAGMKIIKDVLFVNASVLDDMYLLNPERRFLPKVIGYKRK